MPKLHTRVNLFYLKVLVLTIVPVVGFSQNTSVPDKCRLKKYSKKIDQAIVSDSTYTFNSEFNPTQIWEELRRKLSTRPTKGWPLVAYLYDKKSLEPDFVDFEKTIKSLKVDTLALEKLLRECYDILNTWTGLNSNSPEQAKRLSKRFPNMKPKIDYWCRTIEDRLIFIHDSLVNDEEIKDSIIQRNDSITSLFENFRDDTAFLEDLLHEIGNSMISKLKENPKFKSGGHFKIVIKRKGANIVITIAPNFEEHYKFFKQKEYVSNEVNEIFREFLAEVLEKIQDSMVVDVRVQGEADAYGLGERYVAKYFGEWGIISDVQYENIKVNLTPGQITNMELAFLRAYNTKVLVEKHLQRKCVSAIIVIDHGEKDPKRKDKIGTYRNATIEVYLVDYFKFQAETEFLWRKENDIGINNDIIEQAIQTEYETFIWTEEK